MQGISLHAADHYEGQKEIPMSKKQDNAAIFIFSFPALLIFTGIGVFTIFASLYYSTLEWNGILEPVFVGMDNYAKIFEPGSIFLTSLVNSLKLAGISLFIQLPVVLFISIIISYGTRAEKFFRTVYFIPVIMMTAITAQLWLKMYDPVHGLFNQLLGSLGLESLQRNWTVDYDTALASAIVPGFWQWMGYYMLILYTGIKSISQDLIEAAKIDGAGLFRQSIQIIIPMILPAIKICVTIMLVGSMKAFDLIYLITKGGPMHVSEVPTITMFIEIFDKYKYGTGSAIALLIVISCFVYTISINSIFKRIDKTQ